MAIYGSHPRSGRVHSRPKHWGSVVTVNKSPLIHIGTSGWHYDHWRGTFYPEHLAKTDFLSSYQQHFHTVEINNSFYRLPSENTLSNWRESVPPGFIFAVKGSRYLTHMKKLKDPEPSIKLFFDRVQVLQDRLGPIIFQLPPHWHFNAGRLRAFLAALPGGYRYAMEFRDPSWLNQEAYRLLADHGAAFCMYEFGGQLSPREVTAGFVYIRLHGPGGPYQGNYDTQTLAGWAEAISTWAGQDKEVFCYFDNDAASYAPQNALSLQKMLT
jgi:uncharacterized protein YecE (DUF72 family)